jgi:hypothetical protein
MQRVQQFFCIFLFVLGLSYPAFAEEVLELSRSFVGKYKNRITIAGTYFVDAAHKKPNPGAKDGDMHVACRSQEIGLATVAEIQNAKDAPRAVQIIHDVEGSGKSVSLRGVWRIWPEHGGDNTHIQQTGPGSPYSGPARPIRLMCSRSIPFYRSSKRT